MKKYLIFTVAVMIAFTASASAVEKQKGGGSKGAKGTGSMNVQVRDVVVRASPGYMASSAGTLSYGAQVNVTGEQGNWFQIDKPSGWVPKSALTKHKVAVDPDKKFAGRGTSRDEVALAGKGFNPQVEAKYKKDNADLAAAYEKVDRVEEMGASEAELKSFQAAGKLTPR